MATSFLYALGGAAFGLLASGCSTPRDGVPCPRREAAFRLELTAPGGAIPNDTTIEVVYQGNETETFSLTPGSPENEDVCCRLGVPTSGVLPQVSCVRNPPTSSGGDASLVNDAGKGLAGQGIEDASLARNAPDAIADARVPGLGGQAFDGSSGEPEGASRKATALLCELFTNGPATIHVTASGFRPLEQELESKLREDNCGVRTVDVHVMLLGPDGGSL